MRKKTISLLLAAALGLTMLAGCGGDKDAAGSADGNGSAAAGTESSGGSQSRAEIEKFMYRLQTNLMIWIE